MEGPVGRDVDIVVSRDEEGRPSYAGRPEGEGVDYARPETPRVERPELPRAASDRARSARRDSSR